MRPIQTRINNVKLKMESLFAQAGPGQVEMHTRDFQEAYNCLHAAQEHIVQLEITIERLGKSNKKEK